MARLEAAHQGRLVSLCGQLDSLLGPEVLFHGIENSLLPQSLGDRGSVALRGAVRTSPNRGGEPVRRDLVPLERLELALREVERSTNR